MIFGFDRWWYILISRENINKWWNSTENYNSLLNCFSIVVQHENSSRELLFVLIVLVLCFSTCCFNSPFMISIHSDLWALAPVQYLSCDSLSQWKRGLTLVPSLSRSQHHSTIDKYLFLFFAHAITFSLLRRPIVLSHPAHAPSHSPYRVSQRSAPAQGNRNISTHEASERRKGEKNRGLHKKNEIEEKSGQ